MYNHEDIKKMYDKSRQSKKPAKILLLIYLMLSDLFNVFIIKIHVLLFNTMIEGIRQHSMEYHLCTGFLINENFKR